MGRPPAREARDTRQEILDASLDLFADKGFFGTSMREIARAVAVRESAIYHHFPSKEALLDALLLDVGEEKLKGFERAMEVWGGLPVRELLFNLATAMFEAWESPRERKLWRIMCSEGFRLAESDKFQIDAAFRSAKDRMVQLFIDLSEQGKIKPVQPFLATMEFFAPMHFLRNLGASPKSYHLPAGLTVRDFLAAHVRFFCDALGA